MRSAIFTLAGAILVAAAGFSSWMAFLDEPTQDDAAFLLVVGGPLLGGFLGLFVAALTRPSGTRRTELIVLGTVGGLLAGLAYGVIGLEETCQTSLDLGFCGWVFLGRLFRSHWTPIAVWTVFGGFVGVFLGWTASRLTRGSQAPMTAKQMRNLHRSRSGGRNHDDPSHPP